MNSLPIRNLSASYLESITRTRIMAESNYEDEFLCDRSLYDYLDIDSDDLALDHLDIQQYLQAGGRTTGNLTYID